MKNLSWKKIAVSVVAVGLAIRMALNPPEEKHVLTLVGENGQSLEEHFTVISAL